MNKVNALMDNESETSVKVTAILEKALQFYAAGDYPDTAIEALQEAGRVITNGERRLAELRTNPTTESESTSPLPQTVWSEIIAIVKGGFPDRDRFRGYVEPVIAELEAARDRSPLPTAEVDDLNPNEKHLLSIYRENLCSDPVCEGERFSAAQDVLKGAVEHAEVAHAVQRYMTEQSLAGKGDMIPSAELDKATPLDLIAYKWANELSEQVTRVLPAKEVQRLSSLIVAAVNAYSPPTPDVERLAQWVASELLGGGADILRPFRDGEVLGKYNDGFNREQVVTVIANAFATAAYQTVKPADSELRVALQEIEKVAMQTASIWKSSEIIQTIARTALAASPDALAVENPIPVNSILVATEPEQ